MTNVIQTCAPLKNSLALLTNEYHHLVRGSFWSPWPFLLFSEGTLWKFNSRGREDSLGLPSGSWMQSLQAVLSSLWSKEGLKDWAPMCVDEALQPWPLAPNSDSDASLWLRSSGKMPGSRYQWNRVSTNYITHLPDTSFFSCFIP